MTVCQDKLPEFETLFSALLNKFADKMTQPWVQIDTAKQRLYLVNQNHIESSYPISTSKYGLGGEQDSYKTPLGAHAVAQKIGSQCQLNEILRARQPTGECAEIIATPIASEQDLVLTRILWLQGLEPGKNSGTGVDSHERYIYIHGTQEEGLIGKPASHGCVRMMNADIVELFDRISENTFIYIC